MPIFKPHLYQGRKDFKSQKGYFEGWYYKFTTTGNRSYAVIPGISISKEGSKAFIQTIDGENGKSTFTPFSMEEVQIKSNPFGITIGKNTFSLEKVELMDRVPAKGTVNIINPRYYKPTLSRPGIMGWYRYLPFMECYHGVVSTNHAIEGSLTLENMVIDFSQVKGYIEKDWGTSFPSSYIWMQSNCFPQRDKSFMLSVAKIPWMGSSFRGFLGFLDIGSKIITFATYTGAKVKIDKLDPKILEITITGKGLGLTNALKTGEFIKIKAHRGTTGILIAPNSGSMERRISESIDAQIEITYSQGDTILYQGKTLSSGLELVGTREELGAT